MISYFFPRAVVSWSCWRCPAPQSRSEDSLLNVSPCSLCLYHFLFYQIKPTSQINRLYDNSETWTFCIILHLEEGAADVFLKQYKKFTFRESVSNKNVSTTAKIPSLHSFSDINLLNLTLLFYKGEPKTINCLLWHHFANKMDVFCSIVTTL